MKALIGKHGAFLADENKTFLIFELIYREYNESSRLIDRSQEWILLRNSNKKQITLWEQYALYLNYRNYQALKTQVYRLDPDHWPGKQYNRTMLDFTDERWKRFKEDDKYPYFLEFKPKYLDKKFLKENNFTLE